MGPCPHGSISISISGRNEDNNYTNIIFVESALFAPRKHFNENALSVQSKPLRVVYKKSNCPLRFVLKLFTNKSTYHYLPSDSSPYTGCKLTCQKYPFE